MAGWFDPEDASRPVISPGDFVRDRGFDGSMTLPENLVMFHTGSAMPYIAEAHDVRKYTFRLPRWVS